MSDPRIGTINPDGSTAQHPEVDVNGRPYERPATRQMLDDKHFVVLSINFNNPALIEELRALIAPAVEQSAVEQLIVEEAAPRRKRSAGEGE